MAGLLDQIRAGTFVADDGPPRATPGRRLTLRESGRWINDGEDRLMVVWDFLDQAGRAGKRELETVIEERHRRSVC